MLMCIQNLVKFCPLVLKILSGNEMITELGNNGRTGQIQYSPTFSKQGYNYNLSGVTGGFGPELFRPGSFRPEFFWPWVLSALFVGCFGLILSNPRLVTYGKINIYEAT